MRHADADGPWLALLGHGVTVHAYARTLVRAYGFEAPLEAALAYTRGVTALLDLKERTRSGYIAQDLLTLGFTPSGVSGLLHCEEIVPFATTAQALGWIYVAERATLLHHSIRRQLIARLPAVADACVYLGCSDGVADQRWAALGHALARAASAPAILAEIVDAAHAAFAGQRRWYEGAAAARGSS